MTLVLDTGYYLLLAGRVVRSGRRLVELGKAAKQLQYELVMSSMVWAECVSHVCHAEPSLPYGAWEHANPLTFIRHFRTVVSVHPATADDLMEAAKRLRQVIDPRVEPRLRRSPTLADACTAYLAQLLNAEIVVTDDVADFLLLLPDFNGELIRPQQLVKSLR